MPERPDDSTLRLLHEVLEEIGTNEAVQSSGTLFGIEVYLDNESGTMRTTVTEPPVRILRHVLDLLRHLDMPSSDIRLDRVFPIVERLSLEEGWRTGLAGA